MNARDLGLLALFYMHFFIPRPHHHTSLFLQLFFCLIASSPQFFVCNFFYPLFFVWSRPLHNFSYANFFFIPFFMDASSPQFSTTIFFVWPRPHPNFCMQFFLSCVLTIIMLFSDFFSPLPKVLTTFLLQPFLLPFQTSSPLFFFGHFFSPLQNVLTIFFFFSSVLFVCVKTSSPFFLLLFFSLFYLFCQNVLTTFSHLYFFSLSLCVKMSSPL